MSIKKVFISVVICLFAGTLSVFLIWSKSAGFLKPDISFLCKDCNVILISLTNLRYDHMSQNGYERPTTPNLDEFAKESLVFDNIFSYASWSLPQVISLYTSLYPYQHGVMNRNDGTVLSPEVPTLVDVFKKHKYKTAAFTGGFDYNPKFGLTNRFDEFVNCGQDEGTTIDILSGRLDCTAPKAISWIQNNLNSKFFVHLQGYDAHCPFFTQWGGRLFDAGYKGTVDYTDCLRTYGPALPVLKDGKEYYPVVQGFNNSAFLGPEDIQHLVALYDESVTSADQAIGEFLKKIKELGLWDNTVIIVTSEHGDMFGKHGRFMRGGALRGTFYDDVLHAPLLIRHPTLKQKHMQGLSGHIDLAPTLFEFMGFKDGFSGEGKSLIPMILHDKDLNPYLYAGTEFDINPEDFMYFKNNSRIEAVRNKQWKLIRETIFEDSSPAEIVELYDIVHDREELYNLAETEKEILSDLDAKLSEWSNNMRKR